MKTLCRMAVAMTVVGLVSGCTGARRLDRRTPDVRLPSAPVLEPSPAAPGLGAPATVDDPDKIGTVGSPAPASTRRDGVPPTPVMTPFGE